MSTQQCNSSKTFNADRMLQRTYDTLHGIVKQVQKHVQDEHPAIVLEDSFWANLQERLTEYVDKRRRLLVAGQYTNAAEELRSVTMFGIRTAVEEFRARATDDPYCIHTTTAWETFYNDILAYADEF